MIFAFLALFGIISGFFVSYFGMMDGYEFLNPVMMCMIALFSFAPFVYRT
jgi:hypothetical protein